MTQQPDQTEHAAQSTTPASNLSLQAVGHLLVEAREQMGLSVDEVASRLRLMPRQVQALESGNVDALPGPAFVRGFLRNYAKLLQIDAEPLLDACRAHGPELSPSQISLHSENILIAGRERKGWTIYLAVIGIVILALVAWFAYMDFSSEKAAPSQPVPAAVPHELPDATMVPQPVEIVPLTPSPESAPADSSATTAPQGAAAEPTPAAGANLAKLVLTSSQTSWVSVVDRDGKEIFSRNVVSGSSETISGTPPLKVVIGNAAGMQLTFNGSAVDLAPHIRANIARLTLE
ncbi:MAG TPA: RodZ domain-containing protein [Methylophilaceae bacterium]|nr:RodZ domain-containing protein [Methylophilaceae bacterium]